MEQNACKIRSLLPAEQREETGQEGDADHHHKQHLVAHTFDERILILDQIVQVPAVTVLHHLQS